MESIPYCISGPAKPVCERPVANELMLTAGWVTHRAWKRKREAHINLLECSVSKVMGQGASPHPSRQHQANYLPRLQGHSQHPAFGQVRIQGGGIFASPWFTPSRFNVADGLSRDRPAGEPCRPALGGNRQSTATTKQKSTWRVSLPSQPCDLVPVLGHVACA